MYRMEDEMKNDILDKNQDDYIMYMIEQEKRDEYYEQKRQERRMEISKKKHQQSLQDQLDKEQLHKNLQAQNHIDLKHVYQTMILNVENKNS